MTSDKLFSVNGSKYGVPDGCVFIAISDGPDELSTTVSPSVARLYAQAILERADNIEFGTPMSSARE